MDKSACLDNSLNYKNALALASSPASSSFPAFFFAREEDFESEVVRLKNILPPGDCQDLCDLMRNCLESGMAKSKIQPVKTSQKEVRWLEFTLNVLDASDPEIVCCAVRDITAEKIRASVNELCLKLWEISCARGDLEELSRLAIQNLKETFGAEDAFIMGCSQKKDAALSFWQAGSPSFEEGIKNARFP